tara:strand:- start:444 stop:593 length:150 start_codon:yes stop_codon:yes gene_type:complete
LTTIGQRDVKVGELGAIILATVSVNVVAVIADFAILDDIVAATRDDGHG